MMKATPFLSFWNY